MDYLNGTIKNIISTDTRKAESDYYIEGILYCGKCNTPKEYNPGNPRMPEKVPCLCACKIQEIELQQKHEEELKRVSDIKRLKSIAFGSNSEYYDMTFDNWILDINSKDLYRTATNYANAFSEMQREKKGLILYGDKGTGKTFACACIVNELIEKHLIPCRILSFPRFRNEIWSIEDKQEYITELCSLGLLVIDDLGTESDSSYMLENMFNLIDTRLLSGKPFLVTTNLNVRNMANESNIEKGRIYSRILESCLPIEVKGSDKRIAKGRSDYRRTLEKLV